MGRHVRLGADRTRHSHGRLRLRLALAVLPALLVESVSLAAAPAPGPASDPPPTTKPSGRQPARNPRAPVAPPASRTPAAALDHSVRLLTEEAKQARLTGLLPRAEADFVKGAHEEFPPAMVARRLAKPVDRDPLVDAYVRWQLTGYAAALPEMNDRTFARFLAQLPPLVEQPRADAALMSRLGEVVRAGALNEADQARLGLDLDELSARTSRTAALNLAAHGFRDWIREHLPETGPRRIELELERCSAMIAAGWNVDEPKRFIEAMLTEAARDPDLDAAARRTLAVRIDALVGPGRMYVSSARIAEGVLAVEYGAAAVYDFDARRWQRHLAAR